MVTEDVPLEAISLGEPGVTDPVSDCKQVRHLSGSDFHESDNSNFIFAAPPSSKGVGICVYDKCVKGICSCIHDIGDNRSQLKPCIIVSVRSHSNQ